MNILIILADALRPRHLGCHGYQYNTSPNIDRLATEGVRFEQCMAVSAHTFPPIVSLLTGQTPFTHGLMDERDLIRWRSPQTRAKARLPLEVLAQEGWLVDGELVQRYAPVGFTRDMNDFAAYLDACGDRPWFYFAEPYDTHLPYNPPRRYYEQFLPTDFHPDAGTQERLEIVRTRMILHPPDVISKMETGAEDAMGQGDGAHERSVAVVEFEPQDAPGIRALYDGEVRVLDDRIGGWLRELEEKGLLDDTLVIVTSDHGEELLERGHVGHTSCNLKGTLHDESIHVPLIMRYPRRLPAGRVISEQVSQVDLMPTLFDLLGLDLPLPADGQSLLPLLGGGSSDFRAEAYAETPPAGWQALPGDERRLYCVRTAEWKLIVHHDRTSGEEREELYHLATDPEERTNLTGQHPEIHAALRRKLDDQRAGERPRYWELEASDGSHA